MLARSNKDFLPISLFKSFGADSSLEIIGVPSLSNSSSTSTSTSTNFWANTLKVLFSKWYLITPFFASPKFSKAALKILILLFNFSISIICVESFLIESYSVCASPSFSSKFCLTKSYKALRFFSPINNLNVGDELPCSLPILSTISEI